MENDFESSPNAFKVVLLGEGAVGKTSLMLRYTENKFVDAHISTIQAAFASKQLELELPSGQTRSVELSIWDTAGQERFHALGPIYYRNSDGALLVFDITDRKSFDRVKKWVEELKQMLGDTVTLVIVGNKTDLAQTRCVRVDEAKSYADQINAQYHECSAKSNDGVDELFVKIAQTMFQKSEEKRAEEEAAAVHPFQRHTGSRRSIRVVEEPPAATERRRKCC